jgi:uridine kinase
MKVIAVMGEPGSGKTSLMKNVMKGLGIGYEVEKHNLVRYHHSNNLYVLGIYEEDKTFSGTDALSMAVQPDAISFLGTLNKGAVVLFEGDRLCTASFLEHCNSLYDTTVVYLKTDRDVRKERYAERGSNQNETWLAGRESKIANILTNMELMSVIEKRSNQTLDEQKDVVDFIIHMVYTWRNVWV